MNLFIQILNFSQWKKEGSCDLTVFGTECRIGELGLNSVKNSLCSFLSHDFGKCIKQLLPFTY